jgi:hypothetical protein
MRIPFILSLLVAAAFAAHGCSGGEAEARAQEFSATIQRQQVEHFVRTFSIEAPARAFALAEQQAHTPTVADLLSRGEFPENTSVFERELIATMYQARGMMPAFVENAHLTEDGRAVAELLLHPERHAIDGAQLGTPEIANRLAALQSIDSANRAGQTLTLSTEDEASLVGWMQQRVALDSTLPASDAVFAAISVAGPENPLPDFAAGISTLADALSLAATAAPELELLLARGLIRYGTVQLWGNVNLVRPDEATARGWDLENTDAHGAVVEARVRDAVDAFGTAPGAFVALIPQLQPPGEQYPRLLRGLAEYEGYVEAGGWERVDYTAELQVGSRGPVVAALRRRLAAERYYTGDLASEVFDAPLRDAVRAYQATHQMTETGIFNEETATSINIPAERRLAQIIVTLNHWRTARSTRDVDRERITVSIPDFHGELWDGSERVRRWRVITGRTMNVRGRNGETEIAGRTPLFSDTMLYVVFNPYWNVPPSIRDGEYQANIDADPNWLVDNGFELVQNESGGDWLRQLPGPSNLLGAVKFLFPNEHDVYMHDTPSKRLFERSIRAFSHGCIRTQDPLELAAVLVSRDREWTMARTERWIEEQQATGIEQWLTLRNPLPVHIEYFAVRGDDDGRMHFLADVYRYDRPLVDAAEEQVRIRFGHAAPSVPAEEPVIAPSNEGGSF